MDEGEALDTEEDAMKLFEMARGQFSSTLVQYRSSSVSRCLAFATVDAVDKPGMKVFLSSIEDMQMQSSIDGHAPVVLPQRSHSVVAKKFFLSEMLTPLPFLSLPSSGQLWCGALLCAVKYGRSTLGNSCSGDSYHWYDSYGSRKLSAGADENYGADPVTDGHEAHGGKPVKVEIQTARAFGQMRRRSVPLNGLSV